jgi:O-antigen/teichoic acid export membrane protein
MKKESFRKAIISLGIARIIGVGLSFGVSIFVSRGLGREGRGALASYGTAQSF